MHRSFRPLLLVSAAVFVSSCGIGAPKYPTFGEASYRMEGTATSSEGTPPVQTVIYRDGAKMRMESTLPTGATSIVYDDLKHAAYIVTPALATTAPAPVSTTTTAPATATTPATTTTTVTPTPTTAIAPIAGSAVRVADADAPKPLEEAWASLGADGARSVGKCTVAGENGHKWTPKEQSQGGVSRVACISDDGIVLEIVEGQRALWQASRLQRGQQDAALFGIPPGYQIIDPEAVAQSVGDTMNDLNKVQGNATTPASTTPAPAPTPAPAKKS